MTHQAFFSEGVSRMMYIEEITRVVGMGKSGEGEECQETSRNGSGELMEGR
jgi:hypothetical protein